VYEKAPGSRKQKYDVVRRYQDQFIDQLLTVTLAHDNVLYCMNNETHEDPAWGQYWIGFIGKRAAREGKLVLTTDMFDDVFSAERSQGFAYQLKHRDVYDYVDISQINSRHADEAHWNTVRWAVNAAADADPPCLTHMTKIYGNDLALNRAPWSRFKPGDSDNAIEEWWRNLLAGVAGVRFHRPTAGIGLSAPAKACIRATRRVESMVKFWDVEPRLDLVTDREPDEAYLAANPGKAYILYLTKNGGGAVGLNLERHPNITFELHWINVSTGVPGPSRVVSGGKIVPVKRPDASAHWVGAIVRRGPEGE
jgi:hypothetical protein